MYYRVWNQLRWLLIDVTVINIYPNFVCKVHTFHIYVCIFEKDHGIISRFTVHYALVTDPRKAEVQENPNKNYA